MKTKGLYHRRLRPSAIRRPEVSLSNQAERAELVSLRLDELYENLEEIYSKLESLEIQLQDKRGAIKTGTPFLHQDGVGPLDSDYWIG